MQNSQTASRDESLKIKESTEDNQSINYQFVQQPGIYSFIRHIFNGDKLREDICIKQERDRRLEEQYPMKTRSQP